MRGRDLDPSAGEALDLPGNVMELAKLHEEDPYLIAEPSEVLRILQDIQREQTFVTLFLPQNQKILTVLLAVDEVAGHILYDIGRNPAETKAVLATPSIHFNATLNGITVRFAAPTPVETVFESHPAFRSPMPTALQYLQRREHFRTKVIRPAICTVTLADGTSASMKVDDLSIGGARLQSSTLSPAVLPTGTLLKDAVLDFNDLGKLEVNLSIASHQSVDYEGLVTHFYGCHMEQLTRAKETQVQKLVFALELLNRPNTRSAAPALAR